MPIGRLHLADLAAARVMEAAVIAANRSNLAVIRVVSRSLVAAARIEEDAHSVNSVNSVLSR